MSEQPADLKRTPLHALHRELGAKLVSFAGYEMPLQYPTGILAEHRWTRDKAGLFDVSHMGQVRLTDGPRGSAAAALERLVPADILDLAPFRQRYALFTEKSGGILDDLMVTNAGDHLRLVVNAACKAADVAHLQAGLAGDAGVEELRAHALLALQGPAAGAVLARLAPATAELVFMSAAELELEGAACLVTRSGYTGEDGFEISLPAERAEGLARRLLAEPEVAPVGLGARDSLRLEAGLCLYGHDIDRTTTPLEAGLAWALAKARRPGGARAGGYPGAEVIARQLAAGPGRRRVGLRPAGRAPLREGTELKELQGRPVGRITSGGFGPTVGGPIAMGYVERALAEPGTTLEAALRGKPLAVRIVKLPFVAQRYHRG